MSNLKRKKLKILLVISGIAIPLVFGFIGWDYYRFAKETAQDAEKVFTMRKEYIQNLSFSGIVMKKIHQPEYKHNAYSITISLKQVNPSPLNINEFEYSPYYKFVNDSTLNICIPQHAYDQLKKGDMIVKKSDAHTILVKEKKLAILSNDKNRWFP